MLPDPTACIDGSTGKFINKVARIKVY